MTDTAITLRRATPADAEPLARGVIDGVAEYPSSAPAGWTGPGSRMVEYRLPVRAGSPHEG